VWVQGRAPAERRAEIGFVFQAPTLLEWRSALDNVLLPISLTRRPTPEDEARTQSLFDRLGLQGLQQRRPRQLSGGQQSRVAIARALVTAPRLLLLDEPFAALDAITREELQHDLLRACHEAGTTVLFVTHDLEEALFLADSIHLMAKGQLTQTFRPALPRAGEADLRASAGFAAWGGRLRECLREGVAA
jgi:NitT/TauT family transport system ATP-binding protein